VLNEEVHVLVFINYCLPTFRRRRWRQRKTDQKL